MRRCGCLQLAKSTGSSISTSSTYILFLTKLQKKANSRKWNCPIENRRYAIRAKISDISQDFRVDDIFIRKDAIQVLKAVFGRV
jgi:hypothetical protein